VLQTNFHPDTETDAGYGQIFAVLARRKWWFLSVFCLALAVAAVYTQKTKPTYKSTLQLLVEPNYQGKKETEANGGKQYADSNVEVDTTTQLSLMRRSDLLQKAVNKLHAQYPDMTVGEIKKSLVLTQVTSDESKAATKIFQVDYTADDPAKTQAVLKAMQQVYLDDNRKQQEIRLTKGLDFINKQIPTLQDGVAQAESNLERFRKTQNLIQPESQANTLIQTLGNVEQEKRVVRTQYNDAQARLISLQQQLNRSPKKALVASRLSQSTRYQSLLNEVQKTELALAQARVKFTDNEPTVIKLIEQRQSQLALLKQEVGRTLGQDPSAEKTTAENPLVEGQLGQVDINLASQLAEAQTNMSAAIARDRVLSQKEQEIRSQLKLFPALLAEYGRLEPAVLLKRETLQQLMKAKQQLSLEIARGGFDWQIVEEPQLGGKTGPNLQQNLLLGAVAGLMLGAVAAFLRESSDDAVHTTADLERQVALPLLGTTAKLSPDRTKSSEAVIKLPFGKPKVLAPWTVQVLNWPSSWEAMDLIYKNIELLSSVSTLKSLMITAALPSESKSNLALGLAISAVRLHKRVLLIDADLRHPSLHKHLNLPNEQGLSSLLSSDSNIPNQMGIQSSGSAYIDILTSGPIPNDPANLLSSPRMGQLMAAFEQNYDLVILDAPPVLGLVDAILTASFCAGVVLVADVGRVTRTEITQATSMLSKLNLIGVVANGGEGSTHYISDVREQPALKQGVEV
jgi:polysaccharide biosynthesis transport protein